MNLALPFSCYIVLDKKGGLPKKAAKSHLNAHTREVVAYIQYNIVRITC